MQTSLNTKSGKPVFPIGIGTWNIASHINPEHLTSAYRGVEPKYGNEGQDIQALRYSIAKGQNHVDCAELYGGFYTDEVVGKALTGLKREDLYIADKLWKASVRQGQVRPTVERMLEKLGTSYIDLLYIHAPFTDAPWTDAIPQIDELIDEGIIRGLAVSNFTSGDIEQTLRLAKHPILANQMNYNLLYKTEVNQSLSDSMHRHHIQLIAYQPIKRQEVLHNQTIRQIAKSHNATPAQIALAWLLAKDALPIPKSTNLRHIDENLGAVDVRLSNQDMAELDKL